MVVVGVKVPVPNVNPEVPYSTFHAVSVPPAVHDKSAEDVVMLETASAVGSGQAGASLTPNSSIAMSLDQEDPLIAVIEN